MVIKSDLGKKVLGVILALTMTVGLCACGGEGQEDDGKGDKKQKGVNSELAKQYVYSEQALELSLLGSPNDYYISKMQMGKDDKVYILASCNQYLENGSNDSYLKLLSMKADGSDAVVKELLLPGQEIVKPSDQTTAEGGNGGASVMPMPRTEDVTLDAVDDDIYYEESSTYEYRGYGESIITDNGMIFAVHTYDFEDWSDPNNTIRKNETYVCCWDAEGTFLWQTPIEGLNTEEHWYYIRNLIPVQNGGVTLLLNGDGVNKITVDKEGKASKILPVSEDANSPFSRSMDVFIAKDGTLMFTYYDDQWTDMYIATYDLEKNVAGEGIKLPTAMRMMGYSAMSLLDSNTLIYSNSSGVFTYTFTEAEPKQLMSYINSDLNADELNQVLCLNDTSFLGVYYDNYNYEKHCSIFTKVNPEDIPDKDVIVLAGFWVDYDLKKRIIDYNKESDKYRVVITEYQMYNTGDDYMAGYTKLNNDILAGKIPDIIVVDTNIKIENYVSKGLLADVGALIAKDEELSQKEFMENVFEAYKVDGKLYQVIPSFSVQTCIGKKSVVGDRTSWTMEEMQEALKAYDGKMQAFGEMTRSDFMYYAMEYGSSDFVDVATGKCNFNSQQFISLLEYANTLPEELGDDYYNDENWWMNSQSQYRENRTMLMSLYINNFSNLKYQVNGYMGEDVSYVGFPTENGMGSILSANSSYVLSAKSKCLEGAWDFIRYYLTDDYQKGGDNVAYWGLPVLKEAFLQKAKDATCKSYWVDENGEKQEYDDYFDINGESVILEPLSQKQADELVSFIESVTKRSYYNQELQNIVTEEIDAFFTGQKSAAEVAKIIQSRAQVYVNENR